MARPIRKIDLRQYRQVARFNWIYYALPQIRSVKQRRNSLHLLTIVTAKALKSKVSSSVNSHHIRLTTTELGIGVGKVGYYRWAGFVQRLFGCTVGWRPSTANELREVFSLLYADDLLLRTMIDLYIIPLKPSIAFRITPFQTSIENLEEGFDFGLEQEG